MEASDRGSIPAGPGGPRPGEQLPYLALPNTLGEVFNTQRFRGRRNLVLVFAGDVASLGDADLLREFGARYREYVDEETEILGIVAGDPEAIGREAFRLGLPYPLLLDTGGGQHRRFGAFDTNGNFATAVYVTDRFGEVQERWLTALAQPLPTQEQVLARLRFVEIQCPE